jgi:hypothetical protein
MKNLILIRVLCSVLLGVPTAAQAELVVFDLTLDQLNPAVGPQYFGSLAIDDSFLQPNTFVEGIHIDSLEVTVIGEHFDEADIVTPTDIGTGAMGLSIDANGNPDFDSTLAGPFFTLVNGNGFQLSFRKVDHAYIFLDTASSGSLSTGTWSLAQVEPEIVLFELRLDELEPTVGPQYFGFLEIDPVFLAPNTFVEAIDITSLEVTVMGEPFDKADTLAPTDIGFGAMGLSVDANGDPEFDTTLPGQFFNLLNGNGFQLGLRKFNHTYIFVDTVTAETLSTGTWTLVPEPDGPLLLAMGVIGLVTLNRARRRDATVRRE